MPKGLCRRREIRSPKGVSFGLLCELQIKTILHDAWSATLLATLAFEALRDTLKAISNTLVHFGVVKVKATPKPKPVKSKGPARRKPSQAKRPGRANATARPRCPGVATKRTKAPTRKRQTRPTTQRRPYWKSTDDPRRRA